VGDVLTLSHRVAFVVVVALITLPLAGCALDVDYSTGNWSCGATGECPNGYACSSSGLCELVLQPIVDASLPADEIDAALPDAPPGTPDARPVPDAPPGTPDARPVPDARPPDAAPPPDAMLPPDAAPPPDAAVPPTVVTFTSVRDTQLFSPDPTFNFGNFAEIKCAARVSPTPAVDSPVLFGWNVSMIPPGAHVVSATMRLTVSSNAMTGGVISAFALTEDWVEGTQDGTPGVANYLQRKTNINWSTPGAGSASRVEPAFATSPVNQAETAFDFPLPPSLVQGWVNNSSNNFGVVLTCPLGQDVTFYTRLGGVASQRPRLTVAFTP
jgi:hypothetical protein